MPDIFDQLASAQSDAPDIFDQLASKDGGDIFDRLAARPKPVPTLAPGPLTTKLLQAPRDEPTEDQLRQQAQFIDGLTGLNQDPASPLQQPQGVPELGIPPQYIRKPPNQLLGVNDVGLGAPSGLEDVAQVERGLVHGAATAARGAHEAMLLDVGGPTIQPIAGNFADVRQATHNTLASNIADATEPVQGSGPPLGNTAYQVGDFASLAVPEVGTFMLATRRLDEVMAQNYAKAKAQGLDDNAAAGTAYNQGVKAAMADEAILGPLSSTIGLAGGAAKGLTDDAISKFVLGRLGNAVGQSGVMAGMTGAENAATGQPITQGMGQSAGSGAILGALLPAHELPSNERPPVVQDADSDALRRLIERKTPEPTPPLDLTPTGAPVTARFQGEGAEADPRSPTLAAADWFRDLQNRAQQAGVQAELERGITGSVSNPTRRELDAIAAELQQGFQPPADRPVLSQEDLDRIGSEISTQGFTGLLPSPKIGDAQAPTKAPLFTPEDDPAGMGENKRPSGVPADSGAAQRPDNASRGNAAGVGTAEASGDSGEVGETSRGSRITGDVVRQSWGQAADIADQKIQRYGDRYATKIVEDFAKGPKAADDVQHAVLSRELDAAGAEVERTTKAVNDNPGDKDALAQASDARDYMQKVYSAFDNAGTGAGRGLAIRKAFNEKFYSQPNLEAYFRAKANDGAPLTPEQSSKLAQLGRRARGEGKTFSDAVQEKIRAKGERGAIGDLSAKMKPLFDNDLIQKAKTHFGLTDRYSEAGYIMPDGSMLDLTGRHYATGYKDGKPLKGQPDYLAHRRAVDHREIADVVGHGGTEGMIDFQNRAGAVRFSYNDGTPMVSVTGRPTPIQLSRIITASKGTDYISLDIDNSAGDTLMGQVIERPTPAKIRQFFDNADHYKAPEGTAQPSARFTQGPDEAIARDKAAAGLRTAAALRLADGKVITSSAHAFAYDKALTDGDNLAGAVEGFVKDGRFIFRDEALKEAGGSTAEDIRASDRSQKANKITPEDHALLDQLGQSPDYPRAGAEVSGLRVRDHVPNMASIGSSFDNHELLPGVREVPMSAFSGRVEKGERVDERTQKLAEQIRKNGEINPLIVAHDKEGPYILEGGHRFDALGHLGHETFPARVVTDRDEPQAPKLKLNKQGERGAVGNLAPDAIKRIAAINKGEKAYREKVATGDTSSISGPRNKAESDEVYRALYDRERAKADFHNYVEQQKREAKFQAIPGIVRPLARAAAYAPSIPRRIAVGGHGIVFPVTHAGDLLLNPLRWRSFVAGFLRTYAAAINPRFHEAMMGRMQADDMFGLAARAKLDVELGDKPVASGNRKGSPGSGLPANSTFKVGERAWDALKVMRYDLWKTQMQKYLKREPNMSESDRLDLAQNLATWANHATGSGKGGLASGWTSKFLFGPKLTQSKLNRMFVDPLTTVRDILNPSATVGQKAVAWTRVRGAASYATTLAGFLMANQAYLKSQGSEQSINLTDPTKGDFWSFKIAGTDLAIPGMHSELRYLAQLMAVPWSDGNRQDNLKTLGADYLKSKVSPTVQLGMDATGQDFRGRPLPWSSQEFGDKKYGSKIVPVKYLPRYSWPEYLATKMPIPTTGPSKYVYDQFRTNGMSPKDALMSVRGLTISGLGMLGFHAHEDYSGEKQAEPQKRPAGTF